MAFSSDAALAQIPEELRAEMPQLGFRRDHDGRFFFFPYSLPFRGAYEVPDSKLPAVVQAAAARPQGRLHLVALAIFAAAFVVAFLVGDGWVFGPGQAPLPAPAYRMVPAVVFGGSLFFAGIATAMWYRLRNGHFARCHFQGLRYDRRAWRPHVPEKATTLRARAMSLVPIAALLSFFYALGDTLIAAAQVQAYGVLVYGLPLLLPSLLLLLLLLAILLGRPTTRWASAVSWAAPSAATAERWRANAEAAWKARPLWEKILFPEYRNRWLTLLHLAVQSAVVMALIIVATDFWWDRRPTDTDLLAFFTETAATASKQEPNQRDAVFKWPAGPTVHLSGGEAGRESATLEDVLETFSELTGQAWRSVDQAAAADIRIVLTYQDDTPAPPETRVANVKYSFDGAGRMTGGELVLFYQPDYRAIFHWGLAKIAGLRGDSSVGDRSVLGGAETLTALDRAALLLLYSPEITPGLPKPQAIDTARQIVAGWPETYTVDGLRDSLQPNEEP